MAQTLENLVRMLTKTVDKLVSKLRRPLQNKLDKQTVEIAKLTVQRTESIRNFISGYGLSETWRKHAAERSWHRDRDSTPFTSREENATVASAEMTDANKRYMKPSTLRYTW